MIQEALNWPAARAAAFAASAPCQVTRDQAVQIAYTFAGLAVNGASGLATVPQPPYPDNLPHAKYALEGLAVRRERRAYGAGRRGRRS